MFFDGGLPPAWEYLNSNHIIMTFSTQKISVSLYEFNVTSRQELSYNFILIF